MRRCLISFANNKGADQPAHPRSLISAFVVRCLDSIISQDSIAEISRLYLVSVAAQAGLSLTWSQTPDDTFSHDEAQMKNTVTKQNIREKALRPPKRGYLPFYTVWWSSEYGLQERQLPVLW